MTRHRPSPRRALVGVAFAMLASVLLGPAAVAARAQEAGEGEPADPAAALGGYEGRAASSGLQVFYTPEGALPVPSLAEVGAPDALATISSGPTTFARGSAADPGDLLANPDALLTLGFPGYPQGTLPAYPYRATATSGFGEPRAESYPAPGLGARVSAEPTEATAEATMPRADASAIATFGSMTSLSTTKIDGSKVTVRARTTVSDFKILDVVVIDSIITELTATSDGTEPKLTGGTTVSGASVLGRPVTIDSDGVHAEPGRPSPIPGVGGLGGDLNKVLADAGIRVTLVGPVREQGDAAGQLSSSGVRIDFELSQRTVPALAALSELPSLPPLVPGAPSADDLIVAAQARHLARLEVARGLVSLASTGGAEIDSGVLDSLTPDSALPVADPALGTSGPLDVGTLGQQSTTPGSSTTNERRVATVRGPRVPLGTGIGALALLLAFAQPFIGARIARMTSTVLAADDVACPWEER